MKYIQILHKDESTYIATDMLVSMTANNFMVTILTKDGCKHKLYYSTIKEVDTMETITRKTNKTIAL